MILLKKNMPLFDLFSVRGAFNAPLHLPSLLLLRAGHHIAALHAALATGYLLSAIIT
jgi:hypothetical protein